jgi:hypothetical protein
MDQSSYRREPGLSHEVKNPGAGQSVRQMDHEALEEGIRSRRLRSGVYLTIREGAPWIYRIRNHPKAPDFWVFSYSLEDWNAGRPFAQRQQLAKTR